MNETKNNTIKTGSKGRAVMAVFAIILLVACSVTAGAFIGITAQKNSGVETKTNTQTSDDLQIGVLEQKQMILSTATTVAENGELQKTITATITPEDSYNKEIEWSIAWKTDSGWASGKDINEYLTIATSGNGHSTATITCRQAFGVQGILTATSKVQPEVYATCTVDYLKRVTDINVNTAMRDQSDTIQKFSLSADGWRIEGSPSQDFQVNISNSLTKSIGTIEPNVSVAKVEIKLTGEAGVSFYDEQLLYAYDYTTLTDDGDGCYVFDTLMKKVFGFGKNEIQSSSAQIAINGLLNYSKLSTNVFIVRITLSNGISGEARYGLTIEDSALLQPANVSLSLGAMVF